MLSLHTEFYYNKTVDGHEKNAFSNLSGFPLNDGLCAGELLYREDEWGAGGDAVGNFE